jgi:hypothetical protein
VEKISEKKLPVKFIDECFKDYCIYCLSVKRIARRDFCLGRIKSGNICKDCVRLIFLRKFDSSDILS